MEKRRDYLVWAILTTIFCCLPFGIVAIVYAVKANSAYDFGNYCEHVKNADKAKSWMIWGVALGILLSLCWTATQVVVLLA